MENATQALLIAAGVLIGVMILTLGVTLFAELSSYVETSHNEIRFNELNSFNTQFLKYQGRSDLTIHDIITVANMAYENNVYYGYDTAPIQIGAEGWLEKLMEQWGGDPSRYYVHVLWSNPIKPGTVILGPWVLDGSSSDDIIELLEYNLGDTFSCVEVNISEETGRVYQIVFVKN